MEVYSVTIFMIQDIYKQLIITELVKKSSIIITVLVKAPHWTSPEPNNQDSLDGRSDHPSSTAL